MEMIANAELITEIGEIFCLQYYLVSKGCYFGIRAEKISENGLLEWDSIQYLFEQREDAVHLIKILAENTVTPFSMCEVVDELLDFVCSLPKAV
jgi:hypothetical protein